MDSDAEPTRMKSSGEVAENLSRELLGWGKGPVSTERTDEWPQRSDWALLSDAAGLLAGISEGFITTSQPRIRDNLLKVIEAVPEPLERTIGDGLRQILYLATLHGFTAENQPLKTASRTRLPARQMQEPDTLTIPSSGKSPKVCFSAAAIKKMILAANHLDRVLEPGSSFGGSLKRACNGEGISAGKIKDIIDEINARQLKLGTEVLKLQFTVDENALSVTSDSRPGAERTPHGPSAATDFDNTESDDDQAVSATTTIAAPTPEFDTSVTRSPRRRRRTWGVAVAVVPLSLGLLATVWSPNLNPSSLTGDDQGTVGESISIASSNPLTSSEVQQQLPKTFPSVFYGGTPDSYEFARLVPDRASLRQETDFFAELDETVYTFDMLANTAGVVREEWAPIMDAGLRRGVRYRLILSDYRDSNPFFGAFSEAVGEGDVASARASLIEHHRQLDKLLKKLDEDKKLGEDSIYRGSLIVKWNPRMLLYTMWLRDADRPEALCHYGMHLYRGKNYWPSLRLTKQTAPEYCSNLREEFELAWRQSLDYATVSLPPTARDAGAAKP